MDYLQKIATAFELHSVEGIKECFENGVHPNDTRNGKPLIMDLINMYTRGPLFKAGAFAAISKNGKTDL